MNPVEGTWLTLCQSHQFNQRSQPLKLLKPCMRSCSSMTQLTIQILMGDSTNQNTGWKGGTHTHLEKLLRRRLYWAICCLHPNELPLHHFITALDGPTSSAKGFTGPVCSLLSEVDDMPNNPNFRGPPGGEDFIPLNEDVLNSMSTDQKTCFKLAQAVKEGSLPEALQSLKCGPLCHARWLTTGQRIVYVWTREHGLTGPNKKTLEILVKFCLQYYFKLFFDMKVKHFIVDAPYRTLGCNNDLCEKWCLVFSP